jgi:hypothetical protein
MKHPYLKKKKKTGPLTGIIQNGLLNTKTWMFHNKFIYLPPSVSVEDEDDVSLELSALRSSSLFLSCNVRAC